MDKRVLEAMARWPSVPDVYGWLSLTETGKWRLHPKGDATQADTSGESITNTQIIGFINRNYTHCDNGQWYFQNGPQKVYVRLDAAPYIFHTNETDALTTHTQQLKRKRAQRAARRRRPPGVRFPTTGPATHLWPRAGRRRRRRSRSRVWAGARIPTMDRR